MNLPRWRETRHTFEPRQGMALVFAVGANFIPGGFIIEPAGAFMVDSVEVAGKTLPQFSNVPARVLSRRPLSLPELREGQTVQVRIKSMVHERVEGLVQMLTRREVRGC